MTIAADAVLFVKESYIVVAASRDYAISRIAVAVRDAPPHRRHIVGD